MELEGQAPLFHVRVQPYVIDYLDKRDGCPHKDLLVSIMVENSET